MLSVPVGEGAIRGPGTGIRLDTSQSGHGNLVVDGFTFNSGAQLHVMEPAGAGSPSASAEQRLAEPTRAQTAARGRRPVRLWW